eukprot:8309281-Pyramimonas_sp.AAC.1
MSQKTIDAAMHILDGLDAAEAAAAAGGDDHDPGEPSGVAEGAEGPGAPDEDDEEVTIVQSTLSERATADAASCAAAAALLDPTRSFDEHMRDAILDQAFGIQAVLGMYILLPMVLSPTRHVFLPPPPDSSASGLLWEPFPPAPIFASLPQQVGIIKPEPEDAAAAAVMRN